MGVERRRLLVRDCILIFMQGILEAASCRRRRLIIVGIRQSRSSQECFGHQVDVVLCLLNSWRSGLSRIHRLRHGVKEAIRGRGL